MKFELVLYVLGFAVLTCLSLPISGLATSSDTEAVTMPVGKSSHPSVGDAVPRASTIPFD